VGSRRQDHLARAAIEADHGGKVPTPQLLDAARGTGAARQLGHGYYGFLLTSHDAPPLVRASSAFLAIEAGRRERGADFREDLIGLGKSVSKIRLTARASGVTPSLIGCGKTSFLMRRCSHAGLTP
jgi:hypothetical protein